MRRRSAIRAGLAVIAAVVAGCSSGGSVARGATSADLAATTFVRAVNAGKDDAAVAISCTKFANDARQAAHSGSDSGISFALGAVTTAGATATAQLVQTFVIAGHSDRTTYTLTLNRTGGRWLVCGRS